MIASRHVHGPEDSDAVGIFRLCCYMQLHHLKPLGFEERNVCVGLLSAYSDVSIL